MGCPADISRSSILVVLAQAESQESRSGDAQALGGLVRAGEAAAAPALQHHTGGSRPPACAARCSPATLPEALPALPWPPGVLPASSSAERCSRRQLRQMPLPRDRPSRPLRPARPRRMLRCPRRPGGHSRRPLRNLPKSLRKEPSGRELPSGLSGERRKRPNKGFRERAGLRVFPEAARAYPSERASERAALARSIVGRSEVGKLAGAGDAQGLQCASLAHRPTNSPRALANASPWFLCRHCTNPTGARWAQCCSTQQCFLGTMLLPPTYNAPWVQ